MWSPSGASPCSLQYNTHLNQVGAGIHIRQPGSELFSLPRWPTKPTYVFPTCTHAARPVPKQVLEEKLSRRSGNKVGKLGWARVTPKACPHQVLDSKLRSLGHSGDFCRVLRVSHPLPQWL